MTQRRLPWLLALLCAMALLRIFVPPRADPPPVLAEAVVRKPLAAPNTVAEVLAVSAFSVDLPPAPSEQDVPGDAFAIRPPPAPPYVAPVPAPIVSKIKIAPAPPPVAPVVFAEAPPPPVPYQVIGTWDDGKSLGVFLSSPNGTLLARQGGTLQSEYKVTAVTAQQVSLVHIASKREVRVNVPAAPNSTQQRPLIP